MMNKKNLLFLMDTCARLHFYHYSSPVDLWNVITGRSFISRNLCDMILLAGLNAGCLDFESEV